MKRQRLANGERKPKGKPRGWSKLRLTNPDLPNPLKPHQWKPGQSGNQGGSSKAARMSTAIADELAHTPDPATGVTRAGILASKLLDRAEKDSVELERVIRITEPGLLQDAAAAGSQNVIIGFKYGGEEEAPPLPGKNDGAQLRSGTVSGNGHHPS